MKNEQKLILRLIKTLALKHSTMSFTYGYDELIGHIVEAEPLAKFEEDSYILDELNLKSEFIAKFPDKGLMFVSNDPYIKVENPIYQTGNKTIKSDTKPKLLTTKSFWTNWGRRSQH